MTIGILADIHEDVQKLALALQHFRQEGVQQIVLLGDVFDTGKHLQETVTLLADANVVGVWGNHDLGLCHKPEEPVRQRYAGLILDFMSTLHPRLVLAGCLFTHGLPHWDPTAPTVYYLGDRPETAEGLAGSFGASDHAVFFVGHFHRWLAMSPQGLLAWDGSQAIPLSPDQRYLVAVAAVCDGWCAVLDTDSRQLMPHRVCEKGRSNP